MKFLKDTSIAEISSILYLIFPIAGIFFNEVYGPKMVVYYISHCLFVVVSYISYSK